MKIKITVEGATGVGKSNLARIIESGIGALGDSVTVVDDNALVNNTKLALDNIESHDIVILIINRTPRLTRIPAYAHRTKKHP